MVEDSPETAKFLRRAADGDDQALGELFAQHRDRLRRIVQLRMDRRLIGRIDPSDVLQETYLEVANSLASYLRQPQLPFFLWVRFLAGRKLRALHRHHLGTAARDARREVDFGENSLPPASSESLAADLMGHDTSPSQAAIRAELRARIHEAIEQMEPLDREVLVLRHFEQLTNSEAAKVLGLTRSAASNRFFRALKRLKTVLVGLPGIMDQLPGTGN